jgi:hypothetical protein
MRGGTAVGEVLFGQHNPSGKLPMTVPRSAGHIKSFYNYRPSAYHRGKFRFAASEPLFEFGHGAFEHAAMIVGSGGGQFAPRARQRQLERLPPGLCVPFLARQRTAQRRLVHRFRLLELDVLALEASGHQG